MSFDDSQLLELAAHHLSDYIEIMESLGDEDCGVTASEARAVKKRLEDLQQMWTHKRSFSDAHQSAAIILDMLQGWKLNGAVWFQPWKKRFRLVGETYRPEKRELCVGVYSKDVDLDALVEDFQFAMDGRHG